MTQRKDTANWLCKRFAAHYLNGLSGVEIGRAAHNDYGVNAINIDYKIKPENGQQNKADYFSKVDIVHHADDLPMIENNAYDFVFASHALEHFPNPLGALVEWFRIVRDGGYIVLVQPEKTRMWDRDRDVTALDVTVGRYRDNIKSADMPCTPPSGGSHWNIWTLAEFFNVVEWGNDNGLFNLELDGCIDIITRIEFMVAYRVVKE